MYKKIYNPEDISDENMDKFADSLEKYLYVLTGIMILPESMDKRDRKELAECIERSKKLIKKLRKHKRSVFRDEDDWEDL